LLKILGVTLICFLIFGLLGLSLLGTLADAIKEAFKDSPYQTSVALIIVFGVIAIIIKLKKR